jgi:N-acetylglucosamine kinase-like BadF-type ATPase
MITVSSNKDVIYLGVDGRVKKCKARMSEGQHSVLSFAIFEPVNPFSNFNLAIPSIVRSVEIVIIDVEFTKR